MFAWTDERVALLTKLKDEGRSADQIARELGGGVTRNAVIGKWNRLGLSACAGEKPAQTKPAAIPGEKTLPVSRGEPGSKPTKPVIQKRRLPPVPMIVPEVLPLGAGPACVALGTAECRWPIGDPAGEAFRFCAEPCMRATDLPRARNGQLRVPIYCAAHHELSVHPGAERRTTRIMATAA